jgi:phage terminase large subunit
MTAQAKVQVIEVPDKFTTVWQSQKPYQIWYGGRGSAKSWTKAIYFLAKAESAKYSRVIFARDTQKNVRNSQYQLFKDIANRFDFLRSEFTFLDSTMKIINNNTGNFLVGGSFEQPDTLRSVADPTDFWAEEPITRKSEIKRQDFFDIVGSLRNSYDLQTIFHLTFNPIVQTSWLYKDFFQKKVYDVEIVQANYWDNPFCPQSLITFLESLKEIDRKRWLVDCRGHWGVSYEGLIYKNYDSIAPLEMPEPQFYGLDFGFNDPCALMEMAVVDTPNQAKKDLCINEVLYESGHTAETLIKRFNELGVSKRKKMICDNARPEMILDLKKAGYRAEPCKKYKGSVQDGINEVQKYDLKITTSSDNTFDEISTYCWAADDDEKLLDEPEDSINHAMDAIRYGVECIKVPEWQQSTRQI